MLLIVIGIGLYYNVIIAWILLYLAAVVQHSLWAPALDYL